MALHNAKYTGQLFDILDAADGHALNQDQGLSLAEVRSMADVHEAGMRLAETMERPPAKLLNGDRPSGLSEIEMIDDLAEDFSTRYDDRLPDELFAIVSPSRRGSISDVEASRKRKAFTMLPKAINEVGDVVDVVREAMDGQAGMAWGFPEGFLKHVWGINSTNLHMVPLTPAPDRPDVRLGDRALVDCGASPGEPGAVFAVRTESGDISIVCDQALQKYQNILGRIIARISRAAGN